MRIARQLFAKLLGSLFLMAIAGAAVAGPLEDAVEAYRRNDHETALRLFLPLAQQGNSNAQRHLGYIHAAGRVVPEDYFEAEKWYRRAAEQNDLDAMWMLASLHYRGQGGFPKNISEGEKWYRNAAEQGHVISQSELGTHYSAGDGVERDYHEAAKWYLRAANQDDSGSQLILGYMYESGEGVTQDYVLAYMWTNLAASHALRPKGSNPIDAMLRASDAMSRKDAAELRKSLATKMTPQQIAEAQKLTREWKPKPER